MFGLKSETLLKSETIEEEKKTKPNKLKLSVEISYCKTQHRTREGGFFFLNDQHMTSDTTLKFTSQIFTWSLDTGGG